MKKVLGVLLAMALTVGAFAGLTILSASAQAALEEGQSLTEDFEGNTNTYFSAQGIAGNGTSEVVNTQKHGGEYALKFSGGANPWDMPGLKGEEVRKVVKGQAGNYRFHAWVYFETMPTNGATGLTLLFRGTPYVINTENDNLPFGTSNESENGCSATIEPGKWIEVTYTCKINETQAKDTALSVSFDTMGVGSVFYIDDVTFERVAEEVTVKEVVNGDAENGTTGWSSFMGGTVAQVAGGANGTANAMKFTPSGDSEFQTIAFDMGAAIIQDEANGYKGAGAGKYQLTFWARTDMPLPDGATTKFKFVLNSKEHVEAQEGVIEGLEGDGYVSSYIAMNAPVELTAEWKKFDITIDVSEAFLKTIKALYAAGKTNAYELILRLDGSGEGFAFDKVQFPYYVDEVSIQVAGGEGGSSTDKDPVGVQVVFSKDVSGDVFLCTGEGTGFITADDVKDGKVTKSFTIYNNGTEDVQIKFSASVLHKGKSDTWEAIKNTEWMTIPAGYHQVVNYTCDAKATVEANGATKEYTYDQYFPRFDLKNGAGETSIKAGTSLLFVGINNDIMTKVANGSNAKANLTISLAYELPAGSKPTGDALPIALMVTVVAAAVALVVVARKKKEQE